MGRNGKKGSARRDHGAGSYAVRDAGQAQAAYEASAHMGAANLDLVCALALEEIGEERAGELSDAAVEAVASALDGVLEGTRGLEESTFVIAYAARSIMAGLAQLIQSKALEFELDELLNGGEES